MHKIDNVMNELKRLDASIIRLNADINNYVKRRPFNDRIFLNPLKERAPLTVELNYLIKSAKRFRTACNKLFK